MARAVSTSVMMLTMSKAIQGSTAKDSYLEPSSTASCRINPVARANSV